MSGVANARTGLIGASAWIAAAAAIMAACGCGEVAGETDPSGIDGGGASGADSGIDGPDDGPAAVIDGGGFDGAGDCAPPMHPLGSMDAVRLAVCAGAIPAGLPVRLLQSRPDIAGLTVLGPDGNGPAWGVGVWDGNQMLRAYVTETAVDALTPPLSVNCVADFTPIDSKIAVPDAIARFAPFDPFVGGTPQYFVSSDGCRADRFAMNVVDIYRPDPNDPTHIVPAWWIAFYDGTTGEFTKLCGPCQVRDDVACTPCR